MNESINPETQNKRGWSVVRKAQVIGILTGVVITVGVIAYDTATAPHEPVDAAMLLSLVSLGPTALIGKALGLTLHLYKDNGEGGSGNQLSLAVVCLVMVVNSLLYFAIGTFIGWIFEKEGSKKD